MYSSYVLPPLLPPLHSPSESYQATDLERVLFESLTAPSIPPRLLQLNDNDNNNDDKPEIQHSSSQMDVTSLVGQAEKVLDDLKGLLNGDEDEWSDVELELEEHQYFVCRQPELSGYS
jgi:hypothetical protein